MRALLERLGEPQAGLRCVQVAGTNGKGSVSVLLAEMLRHAGCRVGLYTSPHLHCFTERVRIDGAAAGAATACRVWPPGPGGEPRHSRYLLRSDHGAGAPGLPRAGVEVAVLETGMGGRLDATNVVDPVLCLITPVSFDHQEHLGATLAAIAAEKAGIIKPGVPVVSGAQSAEAAAVIAADGRRARRAALAARPGLSVRRRSCRPVVPRPGGWSSTGLHLRPARPAPAGQLRPGPGGSGAARQQGLRSLADAAMRQGGVTACWPGRLEWWGDPPTVLLDGAHNAAGVAALAGYLVEEVRRPVRLVAGLSGQRHPETVLAPAAEMLRAPLRRAGPGGGDGGTGVPGRLGARAMPCPARAFARAEEAFAAALAEREPQEVVVVAGSLYLMAAVRAVLNAAADQGACQCKPLCAAGESR